MKILKSFGIIALAAIIGFSMIACGDDGGGGGNPAQPLFSVSGEFKGASTGNALFKAATNETVARSAAATYELSGELEDGDILFRLKGTYDSSDGSYTVSAAGSFVRYTVNGNTGGATATLAVLDITTQTWNSFIVSVTVKEEVTITDGDADEYDGGIPQWAQGNWEASWTQESDRTISSFDAWAYFDQWYYVNTRSSMWQGNWDFTQTKYTVVEYEDVGNGVSDIIFAYPRYKGTPAQHKAAAEKFLKEELKINNADYWPHDFAPWDRSVFFDNRPESDDVKQGLNDENTVLWYICKDPAHKIDDPNNPIYGSIHWINWDTFEKALIEKKLAHYEGDEFITSFWSDAYKDVGDTSDPDPSKWIWKLKENVEELFKQHNIQNKYYWGWFGTGYGNDETDHLTRTDTCWAPAEDHLTFWADGVIRYWIKWGGQLGIQGDWDKYEFNKWWLDDYLNKYLISQNVQPETWYSRVRLWMVWKQIQVSILQGRRSGRPGRSTFGSSMRYKITDQN